MPEATDLLSTFRLAAMDGYNERPVGSVETWVEEGKKRMLLLYLAGKRDGAASSAPPNKNGVVIDAAPSPDSAENRMRGLSQQVEHYSGPYTVMPLYLAASPAPPQEPPHWRTDAIRTLRDERKCFFEQDATMAFESGTTVFIFPPKLLDDLLAAVASSVAAPLPASPTAPPEQK